MNRSQECHFLPRLVQPEQLRSVLSAPEIILVDLSRPHVYEEVHLPQARHLAPESLMLGRRPFPGMLPPVKQLTEAIASVGINPESHVVAYDDEGGGWAARFLWTLELLGMTSYSYLNGGLITWLAEGFPVACEQPVVQPAPVLTPEPVLNPDFLADAASILAELGSTDLVLLDARSPEEYYGHQQYAQRAGHIPGAVNFEWTRALDEERHLRLRPLAQLRQELAQLGVTPDKNVVTYCQAHHRSALSWLLGRLLDFPRIRAYPGSWAEWATLSHAPVATE